LTADGQNLYEVLKIMVAWTEANSPQWLEFSPRTSLSVGNQCSPYLVDPSVLDARWQIGEGDETYDNDSACRELFMKAALHR
jgi:hypothetical protein